MLQCVGYAAKDAKSPLEPWRFERHEPGPRDIQIDILYCGVCHSDLHQARDEWHNTIYPCLPGHEIVGRVSRIGAEVTRFKIGDLAGIGCMVDSCRACPACAQGLQNYCEGPNSWTATYNGKMVPDGSNTFGGYSDSYVLAEDFALRIPETLDPRAAAPLLCAGVTTYSPLRHWDVKPGQKIGVVGYGGLGNVATKIASALGAEVTVFTTTPEKAADARAAGANHVVVSTDADSMGALALSFDLILSTVPTRHDINAYIALLKRDCTLVLVGALEFLEPVNHGQVAFHRRGIAGSLIGSIGETQEVLEFCAAHGIAPDIEMINIQDINRAYTLMMEKDVHYRFVIDMQSLKQAV